MSRCVAETTSGEQCKNTAVEGTELCRLHSLSAQPVEETPQVEAPAEPTPEEIAAEFSTPEVPVVETVDAGSLGEQPSDTDGAEEVDQSVGADTDMTVIHNASSTKEYSVRYIGKGIYVIASLGIMLTGDDYGTVIKVDKAFYDRIHTDSEARKVFEEA